MITFKDFLEVIVICAAAALLMCNSTTACKNRTQQVKVGHLMG